MKNYTYNSANRLVQVSDQLSVTSLSYNGLGQRLNMDAAGVIATYVLDGDRPLTATSNSNTTFYLYGLGGIGEETNAWSYSLPDGTKTPRQLSNLQGEVTLSARYTPWGDTLDTFGSGNFTFGYLGGVLDATTGLLYVGNGQYYDPQTGRFLTRDVYPNSPNPYVPWNPLGVILGPLALVSLFYTRKRKGSKTGTFLVLLLVVGSAGMTLVACGGGSEQPAPAPTLPPPNVVVIGSDGTTTVNGTPVAATPGAPLTPLAVPCPTPTATPIPTKIAYLTFDDQPNGLTPQVLSKLQQYDDIKATFFVVGNYIADIGYMPQIVSGGHTIGLHSMSHAYYPWYTDPSYASAYDQLTELINLVTPYNNGVQPNLWRAPGGYQYWEDKIPEPYDKSFYRYAWDIDPQDLTGYMGNVDYIYDQYLSQITNDSRDSIIILLHGWTPDVLDKIIPDLKGRGYQFDVLPRQGDPIGPIIGSIGGK